MEFTPEYKFRLSVDLYRKLPDGQRKAYMTGVLDMVCFSYVYANPQYYKAGISAMVEYVKKLNTDEISEKFDQYLASYPDQEKHSAANIFFVALGKWCGLDK